HGVPAVESRVAPDVDPSARVQGLRRDVSVLGWKVDSAVVYPFMTDNFQKEVWAEDLEIDIFLSNFHFALNSPSFQI
ncbi:hypothetical protein QHH03_31980, partial [Aphanizomenon sp. 202]|nr:hypothetical protein [Aphanizomenon sp. 202]